MLNTNWEFPDHSDAPVPDSGEGEKMAENVDSRGNLRGRCSSCACDGYSGGSEKKRCTGCGHPPGKHQNLSTSSVGSTGQSSVSASSSGVSMSSFSPPRPAATFDGGASSRSDSAFFISRSPALAYQCRYPGCQMEADFDPNTGVQKAYCQQHTLYTQFHQQSDQASYDPFTTPRSHWSVGNTDSSDFASSQSDSSDDEQDQSSSKRVYSDAGRPKSATMPQNSSSQSTKGGGLASVFASFFQFGTQRAPNERTKPQPVTAQTWRPQPPGVPTPPVARPTTAPPPPVQVQQPIPPASLNLSGEINRSID